MINTVQYVVGSLTEFTRSLLGSEVPMSAQINFFTDSLPVIPAASGLVDKP